MDAKEVLTHTTHEWAYIFDRLDPTEVQDMEREADLISQNAARLSVYLERRTVGDSHEQAITASEKVTKKIRKALGYFPLNRPL